MKPNRNYDLLTDRKRVNLSPSPPPKRKNFIPSTEPKSMGKLKKHFRKNNITTTPFGLNKLSNELEK
jgi:hypothetical protein